MSEQQVLNMIQEVAILSGHVNDGKLSFRDYCACMTYERNAEATNAELDAKDELRASLVAIAEDAEEPPPQGEAAEPEPEAAEAEMPPPGMRMRRSSFAVMDTLAVGRIAKFEQVVQEAAVQAAKETPEGQAKTRSVARFQDKLSKFKRIEDAGPPGTVSRHPSRPATHTPLAKTRSQNPNPNPTTVTSPQDVAGEAGGAA